MKLDYCSTAHAQYTHLAYQMNRRFINTDWLKISR